ncbi:hypothetical protein C8Q72DRAFT_742119, partial [Fomitopsis betulina]
HAGYIGHFQKYNLLRYKQPWGVFYESFDAFLRYEWTVIVVTDTETDRLHIVTHCETHIQEFVKMIQTRY